MLIYQIHVMLTHMIARMLLIIGAPGQEQLAVNTLLLMSTSYAIIFYQAIVREFTNMMLAQDSAGHEFVLVIESELEL